MCSNGGRVMRRKRSSSFDNDAGGMFLPQIPPYRGGGQRSRPPSDAELIARLGSPSPSSPRGTKKKEKEDDDDPSRKQRKQNNDVGRMHMAVGRSVQSCATIALMVFTANVVMFHFLTGSLLSTNLGDHPFFEMPSGGRRGTGGRMMLDNGASAVGSGGIVDGNKERTAARSSSIRGGGAAWWGSANDEVAPADGGDDVGGSNDGTVVGNSRQEGADDNDGGGGGGDRDGGGLSVLGLPPMKLAMCGIVKDEAPYLPEWIEHHRRIGFDHLLLNNDGSLDDTQCVIDAYAAKGHVTRVPQDIKPEFMENLPWFHEGFFKDNPQQAIFEACRRYIDDYEREHDEVGATWLLTHDIDEFLWHHPNYTDAKDAITQMLATLSRTNGEVRSLRIKSLSFGPSHVEDHEDDLVMRRFTNTYGVRGGVSNPGKGFTHLQSAREIWIPEEHHVKYGVKILENPYEDYVQLAHYTTKSRIEFFNRICSSRYFFKYFSGPPNKPSPDYFIDYLNRDAVSDPDPDYRMVRMGDELYPLTNTSAHCDAGYKVSPCPKYMMSIKNDEGFLELAYWKSMQEKRGTRPIIFGAGFESTGTASIYNAMCDLQVRSVHWLDHCGWSGNFGDPMAPLPGLLAHTRAVRAFKALGHCIMLNAWGAAQPCATIEQAYRTMRRHIDDVISHPDVGGLNGPPYPEWGEYVVNASERIRGVKPIVLLSTRDPRTYAAKRIGGDHENLVCKFNMTDDDGVEHYIGQNLDWCLRVAIEKDLGPKSVTHAFTVVNRLFQSTDPTVADSVALGLELYQERMKPMAKYVVDMFDRHPKLDQKALSDEVDSNAELVKSLPAIGRVPNPPWQTMANIHKSKKRGCMTGWIEAHESGRQCDKLVLYLNFHGTGGTPIIDYMNGIGLVSSLRTNSDRVKYGDLEPGDDIYIPTSTMKNMRLQAHENKTRVGNPGFWAELFDRGIDFVSLENNFVPNDAFPSLRDTYKMTVLRNPLDRFLSAYEMIESRCKGDKACIAENYDVLCPNFYIRMLNGMGDRPHDTEITREHLESAKAILGTFETVIIMEDDHDVNLQKIWDLIDAFGKYAGKPKKKFTKKAGEATDLAIKGVFESQNDLDIELYQFAREEFKPNKYDIAVDGNDLTCHIPAMNYARHPLYLAATRAKHEMAPRPSEQYLFHVHGWPHSGTGVIRYELDKGLNAMRPGSCSIQDAQIDGGKYFPESEGQYLQTVYPYFDSRYDVYNKGKMNPKNGVSHYGKLQHLPSLCSMNETDKAIIGEVLFDQWSKFFLDLSATYLIQKTPTLDVGFFESVKVMPTMHVIVVRYPLTIKPLDQENADWRPYNWLDSFASVFADMADGKIEWYAIVTYEAMVVYHDQVVAELLEVVKSGTERLGPPKSEAEQAKQSAFDLLKANSPHSSVEVRFENEEERKEESKNAQADDREEQQAEPIKSGEAELHDASQSGEGSSDGDAPKIDSETAENEQPEQITAKESAGKSMFDSLKAHVPHSIVQIHFDDEESSKNHEMAGADGDGIDSASEDWVVDGGAKPSIGKPEHVGEDGNDSASEDWVVDGGAESSFGQQEQLAKVHRRLELRAAKDPVTFLIPKPEVVERWTKCLNAPGCYEMLDGLTTLVLPHFGYVSESEGGETLSMLPGTVTVPKEYGHVLYSSEGDALREFRKKNGHDDAGRGVGGPVPRELVKKMMLMVKSKQGG